jgi:hypothetical protein
VRTTLGQFGQGFFQVRRHADQDSGNQLVGLPETRPRG